CFSGGFADVIFKDVQTATEMNGCRRCGFFATVHDREAAGCTGDISEDNYHEYSTYFWAALYGKTRTGEALAMPDYDGDGAVSFAEAHAYVQLTSDTVDIPVCTCDAFLRTFSKQGGDEGSDLLSPEAPFGRLLKAATPAQRAVLEGLSKQLNLSGDDRVLQARSMAEKLDKERRA